MNKIKQLLFIAFVFGQFFVSHCVAQEIVSDELTAEQKILLHNQRELMIENRQKIKESLTLEQKNILENKDLKPKEKHDALMASLNESQKAMIFDNIEKAKLIKEEFRNSLTDAQRLKFRRLKHQRNLRPYKRFGD